MVRIGSILVVLSGVVVSRWIAEMLDGRIALPLVQIALGAVIGLTTNFGLKLEPELFFVLFLPPLLFLDGWRVPKHDLQEHAPIILSLAFGLVFFTVLGVGLLLHLIIPRMPLSVCFALAAVLAPTDVVAATAMVKNVPVPRRLQRVLEGEALFNDASGLVCLRLAVAATLTGAFPLWPSLGDFLWIAIGGVVLGLVFSRSVSMAKLWVVRRLGEDSSSQILISLLIPYGVYLLAETLGCSPVLAAVAAGVMMSWMEVRGHTLAETRIRRNAVWQTLSFILNGSIFLLLGEQLPNVMSRLGASAIESGHAGLDWLAFYVLTVVAALALLRFAWVWVSVLIWLRRHKDRAAGRKVPSWRLTAVMSVAGVRGSITLAGALSLPLALPDGAPFPSRDLAIVIAAGVILVSLALANISLPSLLRGIEMPLESQDNRQERAARTEAVKAALVALSRDREINARDGSNYLAAAALVTDHYQHRLAQLQPQEPAEMPIARRGLHEEERLHIVALQAQRSTIVKMVRRHRISNDLAHKLLRETDLAEAAFRAASEG